MTAIGKPVQIIKPGGFLSQLKLDSEALEEIFNHPLVKNTPIAIYSLAGAYRTGKSFLLNLFLNKLQGVEEKNILEGFHWRGGRTHDTEGIWIWNQPFPIKTPNGKVNVFIMDTQGTFDLKSTAKSSSVIFALSMLISSIQICNITKLIGMDDLENLSMFMDYGKLVSKKTHGKSDKPFYKFYYLIRDWADSDYSYGLEGGQTYFKEIMNEEKDNTESKSSDNLSKINQCFEKMLCFLLPAPGKKVERRGTKSPPLTIEDVDEEFLEYVDILFSELFDAKTVVAKMINGKQLVGKDLINFVISYHKVFESGKLPDLKSIAEANRNAAIIQIVEEARDLYCKNMKLKLTKYVAEDQFMEIHGSCKDKALQLYDESLKLGDDEFLKSKQDFLVSLCEQQMESFNEKNKTYLAELKVNLLNSLRESVASYDLMMNKKCNNQFVLECQLKSIHDEALIEALDLFKSKHTDKEIKIGAQFNIKLQEKLETNFQAYCTTNKINKQQAMSQNKDFANEKKENYITVMTKLCGRNYVEESTINNAHENWRKSMINDVKKQIDKNFIQDCIDLINTLITDQKHKIVTLNSDNKKRQQVEMELFVSKLADEYRNKINMVIEGRYVEESCLKKKHEELFRDCKNELENKLKEVKFKNTYQTNLIKKMEACYETIKKNNEKNKAHWLRSVGKYALFGALIGGTEGVLVVAGSIAAGGVAVAAAPIVATIAVGACVGAGVGAIVGLVKK